MNKISLILSVAVITFLIPSAASARIYSPIELEKLGLAELRYHAYVDPRTETETVIQEKTNTLKIHWRENGREVSYTLDAEAHEVAYTFEMTEVYALKDGEEFLNALEVMKHKVGQALRQSLTKDAPDSPLLKKLERLHNTLGKLIAESKISLQTSSLD
ncbi:MAG: hypothetical protein HY593_04535 [Candidatus Omnitrophica bacterium]|nr:hypothetical protein [Candidatus Omnitrophota bacterium]